MALADDTTKPTVITLVCRDIHAREAKFEFTVPSSVWSPTTGLIADLKTIRDNLVTAFNAVFNGLVYRAFMTQRQTDDTSTLGAAGSDLSKGAAIVVNLETAGKSATMVLPSPEDTIFVGSSGVSYNIVDVADAALNTYLDMFQTTGGSFTISDGETIADDANPAQKGRRVTRKVKAPIT